MSAPLVCRPESTRPGLLVVRLGSTTLGDDALRRALRESKVLWGVSGLSVLEVPGRDFTRLADIRPIVVSRRALFVAEGDQLTSAGFSLLPTFDHPHWTLLVDDDSSDGFARLRALFRGPIPNPVFGRADEG